MMRSGATRGGNYPPPCHSSPVTGPSLLTLGQVLLTHTMEYIMGPVQFMSRAFKAAGRGADLSFTLFDTAVSATEAASKNLVTDTALIADSVHQVAVVANSQAYAWRIRSQAKMAEKRPNLAKLVAAHIEEVAGEAQIEYVLEKKAKPEKAVAPVSEKKEEAKKA